MKALLIAEKPMVAKAIKVAYEKISNQLPYEIDFIAASGHLVSLCEPEEYCEEWKFPNRSDVLPMIPEQFKLKVTNAPYFNAIKTQLENNHYDVLINACDQGREGFLIFHLITAALGCTIPVLRFWAEDISERTCMMALQTMKPEEYYKGYIEAGYLRAYLDWLFGMNFSRAASNSFEYKVSIGRVMTAVLAMIVNREDEITNFKPIDYHSLVIDFQHSNGNYKGTLINPTKLGGLPQTAFFDRSGLMKASAFINMNATISNIEVKEVKNNAPMLFNLTELQKECSEKYRYNPSKTLNIAESLYLKGLLSYPRTESRHLNNNLAYELRAVLTELSASPILNPYLSDIVADYSNKINFINSKRYVNDSKVFDHPALTMTSTRPNFDELSEEEQNVYMLVFKRVIGMYMPPYLREQTTVITTLSSGGYNYNFKSTGSTLKQLGWMSLYSENKDNQEPSLPAMKTGENAISVDSKVQDKSTTPPKRFTFSTLLSAMESAAKFILDDGVEMNDEEYERMLSDCMLGTAATRAPIIDKLFEKEYIEKNKLYIQPTPIGCDIIYALSDVRSIISPTYTAEWENKLKKVEQGDLTYLEFSTQMKQHVYAETHKLLKLDKLEPRFEPVGKCPKCNRDVLKLKKFFCCSGYFEADEENGQEHCCDLILPKQVNNRNLTKDDISKLLNGEETKEHTFKKKSGESFVSSLILKDNKITFTRLEDKTPIGICPICKGKVFRGKGFFCINSINTPNKPATCNFKLFPKIGSLDVSNSMLSEILSTGYTKKEYKITWKNGNTSSCRFTIDTERLRFIPYVVPPEYICKCPACVDGNIYKYNKTYRCNNMESHTGCTVQIPGTYLKAPIEPADVIAVTRGNYIKKKVTSSNGKTFETTLWLVNDPQRGYILSYRK